MTNEQHDEHDDVIEINGRRLATGGTISEHEQRANSIANASNMEASRLSNVINTTHVPTPRDVNAEHDARIRAALDGNRS